MTYYDIVKKSVLSFSIDSLLSGSYVYSDIPMRFPSWSQYVSKIGNDFLYVRNVGFATADTSSVKRFTITTSSGEIISQYDWSPVENRTDRYTIYNYSYTAIAPDHSKIAIGTSLGAILETYSLKDDITPISTRYFIEPAFLVTPGSYDFNESSILGFNDVFATNDQLFTAYDGEVKILYNRAKGGKSINLLFSQIAVFDWDGTPKKLIRTNMRTEKLCYNASENIIYAAVENKEGLTFLAKLKL